MNRIEGIIKLRTLQLKHFQTFACTPSNTVTTLIALLKTASTLLLKFSQQLHLMLTASDALRVHWPDSLKSSEEKGQWTEHKMGMLAKASEDLLMSSEYNGIS